MCTNSVIVATGALVKQKKGFPTPKKKNLIPASAGAHKQRDCGDGRARKATGHPQRGGVLERRHLRLRHMRRRQPHLPQQGAPLQPASFMCLPRGNASASVSNRAHYALYHVLAHLASGGDTATEEALSLTSLKP